MTNTLCTTTLDSGLATPASRLGLVHAVGLAPTKSLRTPDLQSGAIAAQPHMQNQIRYAKKIDEGSRAVPRIHFEAHFS
jgi:hypothetical protein